MRGDHAEPAAVFSYISPAQRVPKDHPLRAIRTIVDEVLRRLWSDFEALYSHVPLFWVNQISEFWILKCSADQ